MLSEQMIAILEKQRLGFVATFNKDHGPSVSPKGTFVVIDNATIAFGDIRSPGTLGNLRADPRLEVNFVDPITRRGFRARGTAAIAEKGSGEFDALRPHFDRWGSLSVRIQRIVVIRVTKALPLETPAYDDGATEDELRAAWTATLTAP